MTGPVEASKQIMSWLGRRTPMTHVQAHIAGWNDDALRGMREVLTAAKRDIPAFGPKEGSDLDKLIGAIDREQRRRVPPADPTTRGEPS